MLGPVAETEVKVKLFLVSIVATFATASFILVWGNNERKLPPPAHQVPTVEMVRDLSELTTVKVVLADVVTTRINGVTGSVEAALLVSGDYTMSTDLSSARFGCVDDLGRRVTVELP